MPYQRLAPGNGYAIEYSEFRKQVVAVASDQNYTILLCHIMT